MKKQFKIAVIILAVFTFSACEDFVNIHDKTAITDFPVNLEQCNILLNSCYAGTHSIGMYQFYWYPMAMYLYEHTSDIFGAFDERTYSAENNTAVTSRYITQIYIDVFKLVRFANEAIVGVDEYRKTAPEGEQARLDYIYGQALFFRALAYWHGQLFFEIDNVNGKGLPIFTAPPKTIEEMSIPRNKTGECYAFMIDDLTKAADLLKASKDKNVSGYNEKYRINQWAAKGLLAKVYMQGATAANGYYAKARLVMEDIIDNSGKSLVSFDVYDRMFYGSPFEANEFNSESVYEIDMVVNPNQNGPWTTYSTGSGMPMVFSPPMVKLDITTWPNPWSPDADGDGIDEYVFPYQNTTLEGGWINNFVHDVNIKRFGYTGESTPLLELNPDFNSSAAVTIANYPYRLQNQNHRDESLLARQSADPRLAVSAAQPWVDNCIDDKGRTTFYHRAGSIAGVDRQHIFGWLHKKFTNLNGIENASPASPANGKNYSSDANIPVIRLADIYLLYAECMQILGETGIALEYVNKVHNRAYENNPTSPWAAPYTSLTQATPASVGDPTDILANDVIKYERWAELFGEGQWWWDVRRWKIGQNEVNVYKTVSMGSVNLIWRGNDYYVQPIPQYELDRNKGMEQSGNY